MVETKKWYQSTTLWGVLIAALAYVGSVVAGVEITVPESSEWGEIRMFWERLKAAHGNAGVIISEVVAFIGFVMAWRGRVTATARISSTPLTALKKRS